MAAGACRDSSGRPAGTPKGPQRSIWPLHMMRKEAVQEPPARPKTLVEHRRFRRSGRLGLIFARRDSRRSGGPGRGVGIHLRVSFPPCPSNRSHGSRRPRGRGTGCAGAARGGRPRATRGRRTARRFAASHRAGAERALRGGHPPARNPAALLGLSAAGEADDREEPVERPLRLLPPPSQPRSTAKTKVCSAFARAQTSLPAGGGWMPGSRASIVAGGRPGESSAAGLSSR